MVRLKQTNGRKSAAARRSRLKIWLHQPSVRHDAQLIAAFGRSGFSEKMSMSELDQTRPSNDAELMSGFSPKAEISRAIF
jgi:hypothetical protein